MQAVSTPKYHSEPLACRVYTPVANQTSLIASGTWGFNPKRPFRQPDAAATHKCTSEPLKEQLTPGFRGPRWISALQPTQLDVLLCTSKQPAMFDDLAPPVNGFDPRLLSSISAV